MDICNYNKRQVSHIEKLFLIAENSFVTDKNEDVENMIMNCC